MQVTCSNGHKYETTLFSECPVCKEQRLKEEPIKQVPEFNLNEDVSDSNYGKINPYKDGQTSLITEDNDKTQSFFNPDFPWEPGGIAPNPNGSEIPAAATALHSAPRVVADPVVGWLVCIKGNNFGKSFPLFYGRNFIGRNDENDVCLRGDRTVSHEKHAIVIYDPKLRKYYARDGESHSIYYVNGELVMGSIALKDHDILEIGATKLLFIPLCNEKFGWDDVELWK